MTPEDIAKLPYRRNVGVMLVNREGHAFVGQRIDTEMPAWQMPQGGIDKGETAQEAALRELEEETGVSRDLVTVEAETKGRYKGQEQKWFLLRFHGRDDQVRIDSDHPEFSTWRWLPADRLVANIVPFKRAVYEQVLAEFADRL